MVYIAATATHFPPHYYPQEVLATALRKYCMAMNLDFDWDSIDRFFQNVMVKGRYFTLPLEPLYDGIPGAEATTRETVEAGTHLFTGAVNTLLEKANFPAEAVSLLASVTLIATAPSLEARVMNHIPFSPYVKRMPLVGYGCMGGAVGLARVADYLVGHPQEAAVMFVGELSSMMWRGSLQMDLKQMVEQLPEKPEIYSDIISTIVTAALFADGATAALMVGDEHPLAQPGRPRVVDSCSILLPNSVHLMGMDIVDFGVRNILRAEVSEFVAVGVQKIIERLLTRNNLSIDQIGRWIVHPGGPKVLKTVAAELGLEDEKLRLSWETLEKIGNISSGTVIYMLNELLTTDSPPPGTYGVMLGMGPGFSQEAVLLQW